MLPFIASQAITQRQAEQKSSKPRLSSDAVSERHTSGKGFFGRVLGALVQSRLRKADLEIAAHRRLSGQDAHK
jgi:hypothetical protein